MAKGQCLNFCSDNISSATKAERSSRIVESQPGQFILIGQWEDSTGFIAKTRLFGSAIQLDSANLVGSSTQYNDVIVSNAGRAIVLGTCSSCNPLNAMDSTRKILIQEKDTASLSTVSQRVIGPNAVDIEGWRIVKNLNSGYYLLGEEYIMGFPSKKVYVAKLDDAFNVIKDTSFFGVLDSTLQNWSEVKDLAVGPNGEVFLVATSSVFLGTPHIHLAKLDSNLQVQWSKVDSAKAIAGAVKMNGSGNVLVAGSILQGTTNWDALIRVYQPQSGMLVSQVIKDNFNGSMERIFDMTIAQNGNVLIAGQTDISGSNPLELIARFDSSLNFIINCTQSVGPLGTGRYFSSILPLNQDGTRVVCVGREWFLSESEAILRCAPLVIGINSPPTGIKVKVVPNPVSDHFYLSLEEGFQGKSFALNMYDYSGCLVLHRAACQNQEKIDIDGLCNGLYFCVLSFGKLSHSFKIVKQ